MNSIDALNKLLPSYEQYYDVSTQNILSPFNAEAKFVSHTEQYFLVHSAKLSDIDSTEHIYFKTENHLTFETLKSLCNLAWENGLKEVTPYYGHRNSDVTVIVLCDSMDKDIKKMCKKIRMSKTYKFMIYGWSNFKVAVAETSSGNSTSNRLGSDTKNYITKFVKKYCL